MCIYDVATTYMNTGTASTTCSSCTRLRSSTRRHSGALRAVAPDGGRGGSESACRAGAAGVVEGARAPSKVAQLVDAAVCAGGVVGVVGVPAAGDACSVERVLLVPVPAVSACAAACGRPAQHQASCHALL